MKSIRLLFFVLGWTIINNLPAQGYRIEIDTKFLGTKKLYLVENQFSKKNIIDSCLAQTDSIVVFKSKKKIPFGIYTIEYCNQILQFVVLGGDQKRNFVFTSSDNAYLKIPTDSSLSSQDKNNKTTIRTDGKYRETQTLRHFDIAWNQQVAIPEEYQSAEFQFDSDAERLRWKQIVWKNCILNDENLLYTPLDYDRRIVFFFTKCIQQDADSLVAAIDWLIAEANESKILQKQYLNQLFSIFSANHLYDEATVHLFNQYCSSGYCDWLDPAWNQVFRKRISRANKIVTGAKVPALEAFDMNQNKVSTENMNNKNILLWFWDPDCDHCIEETPKLYQKYIKLKERYDLEVYAISITEDSARWKTFIEKHGLNWINVSYAMGNPNYDFINYFDLMTTPVAYLINKNHHIVAHNFRVVDIEKILKQL